MIPGETPSLHLPMLTRAKQWIWPRTRSPSKNEWHTVQTILEHAATLRDCSEKDLLSRSQELRRKVAGGAAPVSEAIVVPGFALVYEATKRSLGITLYDEQLLAGLILTHRCIAEMQTGEGKTFLASLPAFVHALSGRGVHVVTANEYLAARDYKLMSPVYELLGVSVGLNRHDIPFFDKHAAYAGDVTYGADQEFGFDYLRDQLRLWSHPEAMPGMGFRSMLRGQCPPKAQTVQRRLVVAIVDEIDSVLIDSATSPLLLSQSANDADVEIQVYHAARDMALEFTPGVDYTVDRVFHTITVNDSGKDKTITAGEKLPTGGLRRPWNVYIEQALHSKEFLQKDVDYVLREGKVLLVDEFTGRFYPDRQWRDGLHQAVEAKEGVMVNAEHRSMARISRQRYFQLYSQLSGMTGTASGSEREFWRLYQLQIVRIPPHKPCRRETYPSRFCANIEAKYDTIVAEIAALHKIGRPILVGTRTIKNSELLAAKLDSLGIPYQLLNGKQDAEEAAIVARSGEISAVTIATNMAGRGTDISLAPGVAERGGLHVIGVEHHEARRIDRQLAGRAARQGDPGSCRFYTSADDPLVEKYAPGLGRIMRNFSSGDDSIRLNLSKEIARVQRRAERQHYWARRNLNLHDRWLREILSKCDK